MNFLQISQNCGKQSRMESWRNDLCKLMVSLVLFCSINTSSWAQSSEQYHPLMKADIQALLPGKTIVGEYKFLRGDAQTYDFTEKHFADGTTHYTDDKAKAIGVWYTLGDRKVCYRYLESEAMGTQISCFWIYQLEKCYYGYSAAQMTLSGPTNYDDWIARWIIKGTGGQCAAPTS